MDKELHITDIYPFLGSLSKDFIDKLGNPNLVVSKSSIYATDEEFILSEAKCKDNYPRNTLYFFSKAEDLDNKILLINGEFYLSYFKDSRVLSKSTISQNNKTIETYYYVLALRKI